MLRARKRHPFRAEPPRIARYREYPPPDWYPEGVGKEEGLSFAFGFLGDKSRLMVCTEVNVYVTDGTL